MKIIYQWELLALPFKFPNSPFLTPLGGLFILINLILPKQRLALENSLPKFPGRET